MPILTVGPNSTFHTIKAAMLAAVAGDTIQLQHGYKGEHATVTHTGMTVTGDASSTGIVLQLATGIATFTLAGTAPINVLDASDGNGIVGNDGNNVVTVTNGADAVNGGLGLGDRLVVDYHLGTTAVTGDSTSEFHDASGRLVTINGGFENFTILTGAGVDTITTGDGNDIINTGEGASTVTAGEGANIITGGSGADTITALNGGNVIDGGDGANTITAGTGNDIITGGLGADTVSAGGGADLITVRGGSDTVHGEAGVDRLVVNYATSTTAVTMLAPGGTLAAGHSGTIADTGVNTTVYDGVENFTVIGGTANDLITTGGGTDLIKGGMGKDTMAGGLGADSFVFSLKGESTVGATRDVITDFSRGQHDLINLRGIDAMSGAGNQHFEWIGGHHFSHTAGELHFVKKAGFLLVTGDINGDGKADFQIEVHGAGHLTAHDFLL
jgi:Ca2+-binding RTX toxin-like protein